MYLGIVSIVHNVVLLLYFYSLQFYLGYDFYISEINCAPCFIHLPNERCRLLFLNYGLIIFLRISEFLLVLLPYRHNPLLVTEDETERRRSLNKNNKNIAVQDKNVTKRNGIPSFQCWIPGWLNRIPVGTFTNTYVCINYQGEHQACLTLILMGLSHVIEGTPLNIQVRAFILIHFTFWQKSMLFAAFLLYR